MTHSQVISLLGPDPTARPGPGREITWSQVVQLRSLR